MKTKIIISLFLLISAHNNFCMLISNNQKKYNTTMSHKCSIANMQAADIYLKPFMLRSLHKNTEIFHNKSIGVQRQIILQCKNESPIIKLMLLPKEILIATISHFFEPKCQLATEYFFSMPLETALIKYNDLPNNNLTLLQIKHNLTQGMIFRSTKVEQRILTKIFTGEIVATQELKTLTKSPKDILQIILKQNPDIIMLENKSKLLTILTAPYYATGPNYPLTNHIKITTALTISTPLIATMIGGIKFFRLAIIYSIIVHPLSQFSIYTYYHYLNFSDHYNAEISKTITKPLKSLL